MMLTDLLMYLVLPLWVLAGLADCWFHRRTAIESTTGVRESVFHLTMFFQMSMGALAALLLEINLAVLVFLGMLFLLHELTTWLELRWVRGKRDLLAGEQMVHSFLELLPLFAVLGLVALHAEAFGRWNHLDEWRLGWKEAPLPRGYLLAAGGAVLALNLLPLLVEFHRCLRARSILHRPPRPLYLDSP